MSEWISTKDRLPEVETEVLIRAQWRCGNDTHSTIATAFYEDGTVLEDNSSWDWAEIWEWGDYDEEKDGYRIPQGWWESSHYIHDDHYNNIDDEVTHWMPLPRLPEEEDENGREEIARPCEFCDGKHAVPYEKNGQMLTPYQETFRTKLFIGDLPWAGKTLFVRSYYCPTYGDSYCNGPRMDSFQINFCPHCGRDLRGDRKDGRSSISRNA